MRRLFHISKQTLQAAAAVLAMCALVFFALTRTQVGRDGLRTEVERRFDAQFAGRIEVGELSGNLLYDLFASDVVLYDAGGRAVVTVDSLVVRPRWSSLFRRRFEARRITLFRPSVALVRAPDGAWNLGDALTPTVRRARGAPWHFETAAVRIVDGRVTTRNDGERPPLTSRGVLFDFANAAAVDVDARAVLDLARGRQAVDLRHLDAELPTLGLSLDTLAGRFALRDGRLSADGSRLALGGSRLAVDGEADLAALARGDADAPVRLALTGRADFGELRRIAPRLPLSAEADVTARLLGPLRALAVEEIVLTRGGTRLSGTGTVLHLPDSIDVDVVLRGQPLRAADLAPLVPGADLAALRRLGTVTFEAAVVGRAPAPDPRGTFRAELTLDAESPAGRVDGRLTLARVQGTLRHESALRFAALDPARLTGAPAHHGRLTGRVRTHGDLQPPDRFTGAADLSLGPSSLGPRAVDSLAVRTTARNGRWDGSARLVRAGGVAAVTGTLDLAASVPAYRGTLRTERLDVGPLLLTSRLATHLTSTVEVDGAGFDGAVWEGAVRVRLDSSRVRWDGAHGTVPPAELTLTAGGVPGGERSVVIGGDALDGRIEGLRLDDATVALARLWSSALREAAREVVDKPYPRADRAPTDSVAFALDIPALAAPERVGPLRAAAFAALGAGAPARRIDATLAILRPEVVGALLPFLPALGTDARAELRLRADLDALTVDAVASAERFATGSVALMRPRGEVQGRMTLGPEPAAERTTLLVGLQADSVASGPRRFAAPRALVRHAPGGGSVRIAADGAGDLRLRLDADLALLSDRNRLALERLEVSARGYAWHSEGAGALDLFADALAVDGLRLTSGTDSTRQRLRLDGVLSAAPADSLVLAVEDVRLRELSALAGLVRPVGGRLGGRLVLTGGLARPVVLGGLAVGALTFDDRLLGRLAVESRYVPGAPDLLVDATLAPLDAADPLRGDLAAPLDEAPSRISATGTVRLPDAADRRGALALDVRADRADLFFFEYLFPGLVHDVAGAASGTGRIGGTFARPLFEADLAVREATFAVPDFGLTYTAVADVRIDARGVHVAGGLLRDDVGGAARIDGSLLFNDYRYFSLDLVGHLDRLQIMDVASSPDLPFYGMLRASGTATLTGPLSGAVLRSADARTTDTSELFIPLTTGPAGVDPAFIVFADSTGALPDLEALTERQNVLADRPAGERTFLDGLDMDLALNAPPGSTVHLVIDPLLGDVINAVGSGRIQLVRTEGEFATYGTFDVASGDYLFTAGDVFYRRFLIDGGTITWDGDPTDAALSIQAAYRTRASRAGLAGATGASGLIPVVVRLGIGGRVTAPSVDLGLGIDRRDRGLIGNVEVLEAALNQPERATEYATSVLLTNSFLLTTDLAGATGTERADTRNQLAFTSLSGLVSSQLNRYLSGALPNLDLNLGLQGENAQDLDVTYGVALRLLDERLVIRGEGIYASERSQRNPREFVVEVRLSPTVSVEVFYRRESDLMSEGALTETTGAGLSYQTQFTTWQRLLRRLLGRMDEEPPPAAAPDAAAPDDVTTL